MTQIHQLGSLLLISTRFESIIEIVRQHKIPVVLLIVIPIFLIGLQFFMNSAFIVERPPSILKVLDRFEKAVLSLSDENSPTQESCDPVDDNSNQQIAFWHSPEYIQKRTQMEAVFRQGYDIEKRRIKDPRALIQALEIADQFFNEFWSEIPSNVQADLITAANLIVSALPPIPSQIKWQYLIWSVLQMLLRKPRLLLQYRQHSQSLEAENLQNKYVLYQEFADRIQTIALSIQGLEIEKKIRSKNPNATVAGMLEYVETDPGWVGSDLEDCYQMVVNSRSEVKFWQDMS